MHQLEAGIEELDEVLKGKRELRKIPVDVQAPTEYSAKDIQNIRDDLNMSQAEFAALLEVSPRTVQAWEHGLRAPGPMVRHFLDIYCKPEMRDSLRFAKPPGRRRKLDHSRTGSAKKKVLSAKAKATAPARRRQRGPS